MNKNVDAEDCVCLASIALSKAVCILQEFEDGYFGKSPEKVETIALRWEYERTQTKVAIVSDYLFDVRKLLQEVAEYLERGVGGSEENGN